MEGLVENPDDVKYIVKVKQLLNFIITAIVLKVKCSNFVRGIGIVSRIISAVFSFSLALQSVKDRLLMFTTCWFIPVMNSLKMISAQEGIVTSRVTGLVHVEEAKEF